MRKEMIAAETIVSDLEREQLRADADVDLVRERSRKDRELLDSGSITDPKQLQSLESEIQSLAARQTALEDVELEVMERLEGAKAAVDQLTSDVSAAELREQELAASTVGLTVAVIVADQVAAHPLLMKYLQIWLGGSVTLTGTAAFFFGWTGIFPDSDDTHRPALPAVQQLRRTIWRSQGIKWAVLVSGLALYAKAVRN